MARYTGPIQKKLRSLGLDKYGVYGEKKKVNPVVGRRRRISGYGLQLKEKQKAKFLYGILERQFSNYYKKASLMEGSTGDNLIVLLEKRLDNVLYRSGLFTTRNQSRQAVNHGHFTVNSKKVNIPSFQVSIGDEIAWTPKGSKTKLFESSAELSKEIAPPHWLQLEKNTSTTTVTKDPSPEDGEIVIDMRQIVEFYSK